MNTQVSKKAKNDFDDFSILIKNSVFGKTVEIIENIEKSNL